MQNTQSEISKTFAISQFNEYYLPSVNRHTFEKLDSASLYNKKYQDALKQEDTLHIIIGMDSGLLANYLMSQPQAKGSKYLFVELADVLSLLTIEIPEHLKDDMQIVSANDFQEAITAHDNNLYIVKKQFKIHRSIAVEGNYLDAYCALNELVETSVDHEYFEQSIGFTQKIFIKAQFKNLGENQKPVSILKQAFRDKTCIVLGGGPSLDEHLEWIKQNNDDLVIIAASRVVGKLVKQEISVDIVVSVDPQTHSFDVNKEFMQLEHKSLLINSYHVVPQILGQWQGSSLYTGNHLPWLHERDNHNIRSIGPTVTNSAIEIATEMGFSQVLLCGVDFCHSQTGVTHAQGTYGASLGPNIGVMFEWVETNAGDMAETPIQLLHAITSLEEAIRNTPDTEYINLSLDAAKVKGVNYLATDQIEIQPLTTSQRALLLPQKHCTTTSEKQRYLADTLTEIESHLEKLTLLNAELKQAHSIIGKLEIAKTPERIAIQAEKLEKLEQRINEKYPDLANLIKFYGYYEFSHFFSTKKDQDWSQEDVNKHTRIYYSAFESIAQEIARLIDDAIIRLHSRLEEEKPDCDISALCQQWHNDMQWGRAIIWQRQHPQAYEALSADQKSLLKKSEEIYLEQFVVKEFIDDTDDAPVPFIENAFKKLQILLHNKHLLGISKIAQYTAPFIQTDPEVNRLHFLALSYQYMLENQPELALETLQKIPENDFQEAEHKLAIQLSLQLNNLPLALEHYAKIVEYSDEYLPQYAHALNLSGDPQAALGVYLDYLDKYPQDIPVMLKLGIFLAQAGEIDGAISCFENVLMLDEHNQAALNYLGQLTP
ncbi:motility associated factor glycosyltransferase family protein [Shewanella aegiceratis]|uniref:motility associated factor glycosyltransferase family protein n=1 Tax=Shewanella aegiceratis TaxID=2864203 RepID=UPI001C656272|nr:6-hydroxymethylpterin diphosphokinase MptE-like protein [Shewanella aegiceratis]QYJ83671.1 DUF115 domain-containing protein [Shewanella aegiceratis]